MSTELSLAEQPIYQRIYLVAQQIPPGRVATYGQIALIVGNCTARMVGYAMAAMDEGTDVPWQRVINAQGKISPRADRLSTERQRLLLEEEGIVFDGQERVNLRHYRWPGPALGWLLEHNFDPEAHWREENRPDRGRGSAR
jgi:methylated-DNA-protein-cysteine methyltransferase related protein